MKNTYPPESIVLSMQEALLLGMRIKPGIYQNAVAEQTGSIFLEMFQQMDAAVEKIGRPMTRQIETSYGYEPGRLIGTPPVRCEGGYSLYIAAAGKMREGDNS